MNELQKGQVAISWSGFLFSLMALNISKNFTEWGTSLPPTIEAKLSDDKPEAQDEGWPEGGHGRSSYSF